MTAMLLLRSLLLLLPVAYASLIADIGLLINRLPHDLGQIPILSSNAGSRVNNTLTPAQALKNTPLFTDLSIDKMLKEGSLRTLPITQDDIDKMALTQESGTFRFYSQINPQSAFNLPALLTKAVTPTMCCLTSHDTVSALNKTTLASVSFVSQRTRSLLQLAASSSSLPMLPQYDPFYHLPSSTYEGLAKGVPIGYRQAGFRDKSYVGGTRTFQIVYRSETSLGGASADVTTVMIPPDNDNVHFVVYQQHEDANNINCSPSFSIVTGLSDIVIQAFLQRRWIVSIVDHEGVNSAYTAVVKSGKAIVDSIQAVIDMGAPHLLNYRNNMAFLYGYSAGSTATAKAAELLPSYAPGLVGHVGAVAVGGFVTNATATSMNLNKGRYSAFIIMGLAGLASEYPDIKEALFTGLNWMYIGRFMLIYAACSVAEVVTFMGQDMYVFFRDGSDFVYNPAVQQRLKENSVGYVALPWPLYVFQSSDDEVASVAYVDSVVDWYCKSGTHVAYRRDSGRAHLDEESHFPELVPPFLDAIENGNIPPACTSWQDAAAHAEYYV